MRNHAFTFLDLLAVIAFLAILLVGAAAVQQEQLETSNRVQCARNLRQIGVALIVYANEQRNGAFPRTMYDVQTVDKPVFGTPYDDRELGPHDDVTAYLSKTTPDELKPYIPEPNDVTAAFYQLLRTEVITSEVFVCPSTRRKPWDNGGDNVDNVDQRRRYTNFAGTDVLRDHLSYSYQNPYPSPSAIGKGFKFNNSLTADFAIAADMSPGGADLANLSVDATQDEMHAGNSLNHGRDGQNVLYADGHVSFERTPFVGIRNDNIYTCGDLGQDSDPARRPHVETVGAPHDKFDNILQPTAEQLGQKAVAPLDDEAQ